MALTSSWTVAALNGEGTVASSICVVERRVTVGNRKLDIAGVGNVFALPPWRKTGLVDRVMTFTLEEAGRRGYDAGLLFCLPVLEKVYARMGWKKVEADVVMRDESGVCVPLPSKNITMAIPISLKAFPGGDIDIMGRDW